MDRFSMFESVEDIVAQREKYDSALPKDIFYILSPMEEYHQLMYNSDFANIQELNGFAIYNLNNFIKDMYEFIEPDVYHYINFTCDYLLNYIEKDVSSGEYRYSYFPDALQKWSSIDEDIENDGDQKLLDTFVKNQHRLNMFFPRHLVYDKESGRLKVSKLCSNFGLYVFKNFKDMFWYGNNMAKSYDKFLSSRLMKAEQCSFTDSDYYILEKTTNINSVVAITNILSRAMSTESAKALVENSTEQKYKSEIDGFIRILADSSLTYSKSRIIEKLFQEAEKHMDLQGELNHTIRYVGLQFIKANEIFETSVEIMAYKRFYEYLGTDGDINTTKIAKIQEKSRREFKEKYPDSEYCKDQLIKDRSLLQQFANMKKVNMLSGYLNAYLQKKFIYLINYAKRINPMDGFVKA